MSDKKAHFVLTLSCTNRPGIVAAASDVLFRGGYDIVEAQQFDDASSGIFFMRIVFVSVCGAEALDTLRVAFADVADHFSMTWSITAREKPTRVLILVSKFDHCLVDLLYRWRNGELNIEPAAIVANYERAQYAHIDFGGIPFFHLDHKHGSTAERDARLWTIMEDSKAELVVLARYMQILSQDLARRLKGRCINIHHSFLPGFKGARPYHQAHARGVKLIGATAHYVTEDLDEGPIIEQGIERISHADGPEDLVRKGRDIERIVLARAVRSHIEKRVLLNGSKTIVFTN